MPGPALSADDVRDLAAQRAAAWFPELAGALDLSVRVMSRRPRCHLFEVRLSGPEGEHRVVVKVRDPRPDSAGSVDRPTLVPARVGAQEQATTEFAGLRRIEEIVRPGDPRFRAVRAIDLVPDSATVVLEHVALPTLRRVLLSHNRGAVTAADRRLRRTDERAWSNAGSWLAAFHRGADGLATQERGADRAELLDRMAAYAGYLENRVGRRAGSVAERARDLAGDTLPDRLATAVSHGDFSARNVFVEPAGRVSVFDPMPRWRAPRLEDVCRFLVGVRLLGLQVHSRGVAFPAGTLDRVEGAFLDGYLDGAPAPGELPAFRLLVLLDKWAALASRGGTSGWRAAGARLGRAWSAPHIEAEANRLLRLGEGP